MGVQGRLIILYALWGNMLSAQGVRDEWRQLGSFDLEAYLSSSLANAHLSDQERSQIYSLIDDKTIHDSFTDEQRDKERETLLSARVGLISLTDDQSQQIIVRGPASTCGHAWNCSIWILTRDKRGLRPILRTAGNAFIIGKTSNRGFHDLATGWHISAEAEAFGVFQWDGRQYTQVDCYSARFDLDDRSRPPKLESCPGWSQRTPLQH
jgi:hypothetical protein